MDCFVLRVPTINNQKMLNAWINRIPVDLDLQGTGADMLKQLIERCFDTTITQYPYGIKLSYKDCVRGIEVIGGHFILGIDHYIQDNQFKYYIVNVPISRVLWSNFVVEDSHDVWDADKAFEFYFSEHGLLR